MVLIVDKLNAGDSDGETVVAGSYTICLMKIKKHFSVSTEIYVTLVIIGILNSHN